MCRLGCGRRIKRVDVTNISPEEVRTYVGGWRKSARPTFSDTRIPARPRCGAGPQAVRLSAEEMHHFVSVLELLREKVGGGAWTLSVGSESRGFLDYSRDLEINGRKVVADE